MIAFFRRLRQSLLEQNKVSRYLLYAIGEILLVVVGILIALQVNNWNEGRKQRQVELKYYQNLKNDLRADDESLAALIALANTKVKAAQSVTRKTDRDSVGSLYDFTDEMLELIWVEDFRPNENTYEEMKSSGHFSGLQNDDLKLKLMALKKTYTDIEAAQEHVRNDFDLFLEDFEKYIDWGSYYDLSKSNVFKEEFAYDSLYIETHTDLMKGEVRELFKNKVFLNNIFLLEINYAYNMEVLKNTRSQIRDIIAILDEELGKQE